MGDVDKGFKSTTGIISRVRTALIAGGAAGNHTLTGIVEKTDRLVEVLSFSPGAVASGFAAGTYAMDAADATAGSATIPTSLTAPDAVQVMVLDAGNNVVTSDADVTISGADIVVADGVTFNVTNGYTVHWFAYDASDASLTAGLTGTDLTSEFSVAADDTINNATGTDTTGDLLFVRWYDDDWGFDAAITQLS